MRLRSCGVSAFAVASCLLAFDPAKSASLTLEDALARARAADARLAAARLESAARESDVRQGGARPNPTLAVELENWGGTDDFGGFDLTETSIRLGQVIELGGKRDARTGLAGVQRDAAKISERARRAEIDAAVGAAFSRVLALQEKGRVSEELERFAEKAHDAVQGRVRAGGSSPVEARRASVELGTVRLERARLDRELAAARRALAATWGASVPDFDEAAGTLSLSEPAPDAELLLAGVDEFPSVALERARAAHARAEVHASIASSRSDLALEAGVRRFEETGDYAGLFSVGLPLPIADRKSAATEAARSREEAAEAQVTAARRDMDAAVRTLVLEIASAEDEARTLEATLVPEARLARDESEAAYANGLFRFTDVLNAQHTLAELSMRSIDAKARAIELRAELTRITGVPTPTEEEVR